MLKYSRTCLVGVLVACLLILVNSQSVYRADETGLMDSQYVVQPGDDLWSIGVHFGLQPEDIAEANNIVLSDPLQVGQNLLIPQGSTQDTYRVKQGESLWSIARSQGVSLSQLLQVNDTINPDRLQVGQTLYLPAKGSGKTTPAPVGYKQFTWPVSGQITSSYGWRKGEFHGGIDIAVSTGTQVTASRAGTVVLAGWNAGFGQAIKIDHGDGYCSIYAHNSKLLVKKGQYVSAGQLIAKSGNTGRSTGPHVHFEVRYNGVAQNPSNLLTNTTQVADIR